MRIRNRRGAVFREYPCFWGQFLVPGINKKDDEKKRSGAKNGEPFANR